MSSPPQNPKPPYTILVLEKAISLLSRFDRTHPEWGVTELSKDLRINKSTISKIVSTFENYGLLSKNTETRKYRLGLRLFELGSLVASQLDLQKEALVPMEELNRKVGETIHLVVMDDFEIIYINKVESPDGLRIGTRIGGRLPAHCTGVGKVLLAALSPQELSGFLRKKPLKKFTPHTITSPRLLRRALDEVRNQGYALDREEFSAALMCVAAPIKDYSDKVIGAISISGSASRLREKHLEKLISEVKNTARKISTRLGSRHGNSRAPA